MARRHTQQHRPAVSRVLPARAKSLSEGNLGEYDKSGVDSIELR